MANPYAELFQVPGARAFVLAGMLARMPVSMTGIGLITMLSQVHGGYGLAGSVAAVFALATAFCAPQVSRLVDRYSQGRVLPVAALIGAVRSPERTEALVRRGMAWVGAHSRYALPVILVGLGAYFIARGLLDFG